jgi:putative nucleotidyltransferase with HDIG domain
MWEHEGFMSYVGIPLFVMGELQGVLEIYQRSTLDLNERMEDFLNILAGQAAIAIDSAQKLETLHQSNRDLSMAYEATIEGWSSALDLRDRETEGHTLRVTELTMRMAEAVGVPKSDLKHIRHGALLHDIGKLGVPDSILHKPGALSEEEWALMRQHPLFAYQLLAPIQYLRLALDIPHYHHERWDGSGYPDGLKGKGIPLAARLFAIIDVYDALTSDRPYRQAWSVKQALDYIREGAGTHFDPELVQVFLKLMASEKS